MCGVLAHFENRAELVPLLSLTIAYSFVHQVLGSYNHNVMFDYLVGHGFFLMWKNCMTDEDCNGQRMLYSTSPDAQTWSKPTVLFPNMTTPGE
jgi:hypothetical protein